MHPPDKGAARDAPLFRRKILQHFALQNISAVLSIPCNMARKLHAAVATARVTVNQGRPAGGIMLNRVSFLALAAAAGLAVIGPQARAAYILTVEQVGNDVEASGSGTIDTAALGTPATAAWGGMFLPSSGAAWVGSSSNVDVYAGVTGPTSIGTGGRAVATSDTGDVTGIFGSVGKLYVPAGYVSGTELTGTSTWSGTTIADLGLTPGTYIWTWGSGSTADSFTVEIESAAVPEPASIAVFGIPALMGLLRRRRAA